MSKKVTKIKIGDETYDILASSPMKVNVYGSVPVKPQIGLIYYSETPLYFRIKSEDDREYPDTFKSDRDGCLTYTGPLTTYVQHGTGEGSEVHKYLKSKNQFLIITSDLLLDDGRLDFTKIPDAVKQDKHLTCDTTSPKYKIINGKITCIADVPSVSELNDYYIRKDNLYQLRLLGKSSKNYPVRSLKKHNHYYGKPMPKDYGNYIEDFYKVFNITGLSSKGHKKHYSNIMRKYFLRSANVERTDPEFGNEYTAKVALLLIPV